MRDFMAVARSVAVAERGMAATSHPQATLAAVEMLKAGGNAIDAALAAVAVQGVVEPQMTGIGGDCFALYSPKGGAPVALNGSGRTPAKTDVSRYADAGGRDIPPTSPEAVTVPGSIDAWCRLSADYGSRPLSEVFAAAIDAAENGFRITPRVPPTGQRSVAGSRAFRTPQHSFCRTVRRRQSATSGPNLRWQPHSGA